MAGLYVGSFYCLMDMKSGAKSDTSERSETMKWRTDVESWSGYYCIVVDFKV